MAKIEAVILDLGNTVFYIDFDLCFQYWENVSGVDWQILKERFAWDEQHIKFEEGILSEELYCEHIAGLMKIDLSFKDFIIGWNELYLDYLDGMEDFMCSVNKNHRLLALSNTNATHERVWGPRYETLFSEFEKVFASHKMGAVKPNAMIYQQVLDYLDLPAEQTVFCDDKIENVDGARDMGMHAIQVVSAQQMYADLRALDVQW